MKEIQVREILSSIGNIHSKVEAVLSNDDPTVPREQVEKLEEEIKRLEHKVHQLTKMSEHEIEASLVAFKRVLKDHPNKEFLYAWCSSMYSYPKLEEMDSGLALGTARLLVEFFDNKKNTDWTNYIKHNSL